MHLGFPIDHIYCDAAFHMPFFIGSTVEILCLNTTNTKCLVSSYVIQLYIFHTNLVIFTDIKFIEHF